ncbi:MAG: glutathione S-transferase N-terminal domain-containing protein [Bacteriovoracaceae bacterium]|nr:glutathione S-transferase N-terminal domain-containing protein [Bacteriovoracaceae bacterium]
MKKLELFYYDSCPYCQDVLIVLDELKILVEMKNILQDQSSYERLINDTGRRTVPCLYIDNKPMFESLDIIDWLRSNTNSLQKRS